jgi:ATP-dependent Clp protease ATP-binding subunit ClpX
MTDEDKYCRLCNKEPKYLPEGVILVDTHLNWSLCSVCVQSFVDVISGTEFEKDYIPVKYYDTPRDIVNYLDKYIIGQEQAKKALALAAYQHYKKINHKGTEKFDKGNVILIGPTGSGKTAMIERLAEYLDVPFVIQDVVQLTSQGYVGEDVEDLMSRLYQAGNKDLEKAQKGIVCLDEVDKLVDKGADRQNMHYLGVQRMLLKPLERGKVNVIIDGTKNISKETIEFDTSNVLFIASGAFTGLPKVINERLNTNKGSIGFGAHVQSEADTIDYANTLPHVIHEDLVTYGYMPEFVGRFPNLTRTDSITPEMMKRILVEPKNSVVKQLKRLLSIDSMELNISDAAVEEIANRASKQKTGARALQGILHGIVKDALFEYPSNYNVIGISVDFVDNEFNVEQVTERLLGYGK